MSLTTAKYQERLKTKYGDRFKVISEYIDSYSTIRVRCNVCGYEFNNIASKLLSRGRCRGCFNKRHTKTHERFVREINEKYTGQVSVLSTYTYDRKTVKVRHNTCGSEYEIIASSLLQELGCAGCQGERLHHRFVKSQEEFIRDLDERTGGEYEVLSQYHNAQTKILVRHKCGYQWKARPISLLLYQPCPGCGRDHLKCKVPALRNMMDNLRSRIIHILQGREKSAPTLALLGCQTREELKQYVESKWLTGMSWDNYGKRNGWNLDHIRPCASFDLSDAKQQHQCFHYTNLQPLWWEDNMKKSSVYNGHRYRLGETHAIPS
jgi:hypothetical protein